MCCNSFATFAYSFSINRELTKQKLLIAAFKLNYFSKKMIFMKIKKFVAVQLTAFQPTIRYISVNNYRILNNNSRSKAFV